MTETITVQGEGVMLDLLLWRRYGRRGQVLVDAAHQLNRGLADLDPVLPVGTVVVLPDLPVTPTRAGRKPVSLFDP